MNCLGVLVALPAESRTCRFTDLFSCSGRHDCARTAMNDCRYACQDLTDDQGVGVESLAVRYSTRAKYLSGRLAMIQVCSLPLVGAVLEAGKYSYVGTMIVALVLSDYPMNQSR